MARLFEFATGILHNRSTSDVPQAAVQMRWSKFGGRRPVPAPETAARLHAETEALVARNRASRAPEGWRPW